ncbi:MAG: hypothetical protein Q9160_007859 [Pyrenula sp. 1 TL-2023]
MEKVKNIFSPGHSKDDELMYGTGSPSSNKGKVSGEGSHFGSSRGDDSTTSPPEPGQQTQSTSGIDQTHQPTETNDTSLGNASKVAGQGSHFSGSEKDQTDSSAARSPKDTADSSKLQSSEVQPDSYSSTERSKQPARSTLDSAVTEDASVASIKSGVRGNQLNEPSAPLISSTQTAAPTASSTEPIRKDDPQHGIGAGVGVGVGSGAAAAAAGKAWKPGTTDGSQPAESESGAGMPGSFPSDEENPYKTSHIDPRVDSKQSSPAVAAAKTSTRDTQPPPTTDTPSKPSPGLPAEQTEQSHKGQDAGIGAAALGAVGLGGYEASKRHEEKKESPTAPKDQTSSPTTIHSKTTSPKPLSTPDETTRAIEPKSNPEPTNTDKKPSNEPSGDKNDHHSGRDAGILAAAAAALGLGSRESKKEKDQKEPEIGSSDSEPLSVGATPSTKPTATSKASGQDRTDMAGPAGLEEQRYDPSGTSNKNITPVGTFDRTQKDTAPTRSPPDESNVKKDDHHYGRDAGLATAAGAAGVGAYETKKHRDDQPAPSHPPPPAPATEKTSQVKPQTTESAEDKPHYARDAGLAGGAAAAGVGSYEAGKHLSGDNKLQREESPLSAGPPPDQMSLPRHNRDNSKSTHDEATAALLNRGPGVEKSTAKPTPRDPEVTAAEGRTISGAKPSNYPQQAISREEPVAPRPEKEDDHTAKNTALGAAGLGAGAYGAKKLHDQHEPSQVAPGDRPPASQTEDWPLKQDSTTRSAVTPQPQATAPRQDARNNQTQPPEKEDHTKRNAALAGAGVAGAGAAAYAGREYSQHEAEKLEKERLAQEKAHKKELAKQQAEEQKEADKAAAKEAKQHEKEAAKEEEKAEKEAAKAEKKHEKEVAKEEKKHEKEVAAAEKKHEKEVAKEEKKHEKEVAAAEKEREKEAKEAEKKHEKEVAAAEKEREKEAKEAEKKHEKEVAAATAAAAAEQREREKEREKLEKEAREKEAREKEAREAEEKERENEEKRRHEKEAAAAVAGTGAAAGAYEVATHDSSSKDKLPEKEQEQVAPDSPSQKSISSQGGDSTTDKKERHGLRKVLHKIVHPTEKDDHEKEEAAAPDSPASSGQAHDQHHHNKLHKDPPPSVVKERYSGDAQTPAYADYAVKGEDGHQGAKTIAGGHTAPAEAQDANKYPARQQQETSPLMDKEAHYLAGRFADTDIEERIHRSMAGGQGGSG